VLAETRRVTRRGGRVVVLVPHVPRGAAPPGLRLAARHPVMLLGRPTAIWAYDRVG
jgi:hypothetical protein